MRRPGNDSPPRPYPPRTEHRGGPGRRLRYFFWGVPQPHEAGQSHVGPQAHCGPQQHSPALRVWLAHLQAEPQVLHEQFDFVMALLL